MKPKLTFVLELTKRCNNNCLYCYNAWKAIPTYPAATELTTDEWKQILDRIAAESRLRQIALSGGEPLARQDFFEILGHLHKKKTHLTLITNGTLLTPEIIARCVKLGVKTFELPLLGDTAELHDSLTRNPGSWERVIINCREIKKQKGTLAIVFVLTKQNIARVKETMEMAIALEADAILANRFNPGGEGIKNRALLSPTVEELKRAYGQINALAEEYEIPVTSGIPVPPCILDTSPYKHIRFSYCPHGGEYTYFAIDPAGNLRPCNHSATILGNLLKQPLADILREKTWTEYYAGLPTACTGCAVGAACLGGCRASAEVCYNDRLSQDPFVVDNFKGVV